MALDQSTLFGLAEHLENCELQAHDTLKITDEHPHMDWDDAYAIQDETTSPSRVSRPSSSTRPSWRCWKPPCTAMACSRADS